MVAWARLAQSRNAQDSHDALALGALAAQGSSKSIKEQLKQLAKKGAS